jgi:hypothetical protein
MTEDIQRAIRHEAGHAAAALHLGFWVERLSVSNGMLIAELRLDSPETTPGERFIVLAAGIAAEQFFYGRYDAETRRKDSAMISERGGGSIETYLPEALHIMQSNESCLHHLVGTLTCRMQEEFAEAAFVAGAILEDSNPPSFELLSREEIQSVWRRTD